MLALMLCLIAADAEPATPVKILASGKWPHSSWNVGKGGKGLAIRSDKELLEATSHAARGAGPDLTIPDARRELLAALGGMVKELDWSKHMALAVLAGQK